MKDEIKSLDLDTESESEITVISTDSIVEFTNLFQELFCFMFTLLLSVIIAVIKTPIIFLLKIVGDTLLYMAAISCRVLSLIFGLFFVTFCLGMPDKAIMLMLGMAEYFEFPRLFSVALFTESGWGAKEFRCFEHKYIRSSIFNRLYFKVK